MTLPPDLIDLLREFDAAKVRYLLIGGYALAFHARPRFTKDVDFWIDDAPENLERLEAALSRFGAPPRTIQAVKELSGLDVAWMGNPPLRFDFMKNVPGGTFEAAFEHRASAQWEGVPVSIVSAQDLLRLKRASGRPQDLVDAELLARTEAE